MSLYPEFPYLIKEYWYSKVYNDNLNKIGRKTRQKYEYFIRRRCKYYSFFFPCYEILSNEVKEL